MHLPNLHMCRGLINRCPSSVHILLGCGGDRTYWKATQTASASQLAETVGRAMEVAVVEDSRKPHGKHDSSGKRL